MDPTRCSETSANKHYTPGNNPKTRINHSDDDESLKSRYMITYAQQLYLDTAQELLYDNLCIRNVITYAQQLLYDNLCTTAVIR
jgi:hypothetical protein